MCGQQTVRLRYNSYVDTVFNYDCNLHQYSETFDLLITDIPYNISQKSSGLRTLDYGDWDKQSNIEIFNRLFKFIQLTQNACYIFCHESQFSTIYNYLKVNDWLVRSLIWLKPNPTVINCDKLYTPSHELIVYGKRKSGLFKPDYKLGYFKYQSPVIRDHPTQKPVNLIKEFINDSSNVGDLICDPFAGSGTTLLAAKETGRHYVGYEIDNNYYNICLNRLSNAQFELF